ncbi:tryptophan-rich sensory protein TspO [Rhodophyticola porphyridii]|uniref:Tryptophan-rich sensory protein n=1 Tax=Rhodophyticola porphyridii TaxID=1852017 RepID=A0A3L9Y675_9RHOB|nr:TspO/MBR family protein [Rhodophyticola porphyridii]RMA42758.1 tryptophan-rich sensory protein [Rhodophyticola porphyridii]
MDWGLFAIFLAACCAAAATGSMFSPGDWYRNLAKPVWTPPNWLFPLAWTTLYICAAVAAARVAVLEGNAYGMAFWAMQIAFNTLWTPIFFGLRRIKTAFFIMIGLWVGVAGTMISFFTLDTIAGLLFVPYLLWVSVAGALNLSVWRLNPGEANAAPAN